MNLKWTKELLEPIVRTSKCYSECLRKLNLRQCGGNYSHLQRRIEDFNLDSSHFTGQAHNKDKEFVLFDNLTKPHSIKKRLLKERGSSCERCGLNEWQAVEIPLELEHVDGNNRNNSKENLLLLCPNCHALTPTWRNRKR